MTAFVFVNYVDTTLAAAASSTATSLSLSSSANLPTLESGEIMPLTLNDAATGLVYEIVYVTAISGTTLTVERAQEGTTAQNWSTGDYAFTGPTANTVAPVTGTHSPVASETLPAVNRLVVTPGTLTAGITLTLNDQAAAGSSVTAFGSAAAYDVTVQSPVTTGSPYIELPDGSQVYSWVIPASSPTQGIHVDWDGTNWRARTFGQEVVAPATQNNAAVNLGQLFIGNRKAVFTANGTYTVPAGVTTLWVSGCAGGGGGSGGGASNSATGGAGSGAGGGAGEPILRQEYSVAPGDSISITIGAGGAGGAGGAADGGSGAAGAGGGNTVVTNSTTATTLVTLTGGGGGKGGSGGGSGGGLGGAGYPQGSDGTDGAVIAGVGGPGGSGPFGGGGGAARGANGTVNDGHNAYGYGSGGGGGGCCYDSTTVAAGAGGNGTPGIIIVEW